MIYDLKLKARISIIHVLNSKCLIISNITTPMTTEF